MKKGFCGLITGVITVSLIGCSNEESKKIDSYYIETNNEYRLTPYKINEEKVIYRSDLNKGKGTEGKFKINGEDFVLNSDNKLFGDITDISGEFFEYKFSDKKLKHIEYEDERENEYGLLNLGKDINPIIKIPEEAKTFHKLNFKDESRYGEYNRVRENEFILEGSNDEIFIYFIQDNYGCSFSIVNSKDNKTYFGDYIDLKDNKHEDKVISTFFMNPKTEDIYAINNVGEVFICKLSGNNAKLEKASRVDSNTPLIKEINENIFFIEDMGRKLSIYDFNSNELKLIRENNDYTYFRVIEDYIWVEERFPVGHSEFYITDFSDGELKILLKLDDIYKFSGAKVIGDNLLVTSSYEKGQVIHKYKLKSPFRDY